tara:strand:+ start:741 stop:1049 length:309 start_codon:yes stop_codon:yes gene_type:complete
MCIGLPLEVRTAAVKYVKNKIIEDHEANKDTMSQDGLNEFKRIKYNFHENELKDNMNDATLIDVAFKNTDKYQSKMFSFNRPQPLDPLSVPIVIFSGIDPRL